MAKKDDDPAISSPASKSAARPWWRKLFRPARRTAQERHGELERTIDKLGMGFSTPENILEADEREMIHGVVELGETAVKEVMIPRVEIIGIPVQAGLSEAITIIKETGHSRFPLYSESLDDIKGILYAKDLLSFAFDKGEVNLVDIVRKPYFIHENIRLDVLLRELKKKRLHIAIVVDEYGGTAGLVTLEDILEEIVGEIEDEYDGEPPAIVKESNDTYVVGGSVTIADLNDEAGLDLPEEEFETVGGLIYDLVGSLPEKGRSVKYHDLTFVVDKVEGQRIVKVKIHTDRKKASGENPRRM